MLVAVHSLSAESAVFADLALHLAVGGLCLGLVELSFDMFWTCCESSPGPSVPLMARVESLHFSAQP